MNRIETFIRNNPMIDREVLESQMIAEGIDLHSIDVNSILQRASRNSDFLIHNFLSQRWKWSHIRQHPGEIPLMMAMLPFGMIGYMISLPVRLMIFTVAAVSMVRILCSALYHLDIGEQRRREIYDGFMMLGGVSGELASGLIGCALPPVAYKFDEWIQSNPSIHRQYQNHFPLWVEINGEQHQFSWASTWRHEIGDLDPLSLFFSNLTQSVESLVIDNQLSNRTNQIRDHHHIYRNVKADLSNYLVEDEICASESLLSMIPTLSFLKLFLEPVAGRGRGIDNLNLYIRSVDDLLTDQTQLNAFHEQINLLSAKGESLKNQYGSHLYTQCLAKLLLEEEVSRDHPNDPYFLPDVRETLEAQLEPVRETLDFLTFYVALKNFTQTVINIDRTLYSAIGRTAFQ